MCIPANTCICKHWIPNPIPLTLSPFFRLSLVFIFYITIFSRWSKLLMSSIHYCNLPGDWYSERGQVTQLSLRLPAAGQSVAHADDFGGSGWSVLRWEDECDQWHAHRWLHQGPDGGECMCGCWTTCCGEARKHIVLHWWMIACDSQWASQCGFWGS